ncbi:hypothetical protein HCZ30_01095 [Marivivens donghaensis]|uniref:Extensin-like C-terminal domain-containing protein n=1 Tax=Marivivens donghaensis TaxID=1699413 RepID=A0ABX0VUX8_9RHOB|nr:extensin family protein [Marivivens donghaensis]NIY71026.1 hypothetical protein [Marivivens donghaensis]
MKLGLALALTLWGGAVWANAPAATSQPRLRPTEVVVSASGTAVARPRLRPAALAPAPSTPESTAARVAMEPETSSQFAVRRSSRPSARPPHVVLAGIAAAEARRRGSICGDFDIQGEEIADINGPGPCGVEGAVRIRSILGIGFSEQPTVDCRTASAFKTWLERGAIPAVGSEGGGIKEIWVMGHYSCRNQIGNSSSRRLSEHALGHAIDVGGLRLNDGGMISVKDGWGTRSDGGQLRDMHQAACGPFGTVLGPNANAAHHDHFHFDTARNRNSAYCR